MKILTEDQIKKIKVKITHLTIDIDSFEEELSVIPRHPNTLIDAVRREGIQAALEHIVFNGTVKKLDTKKFVRELFGEVNNFKVAQCISRKFPEW